MKLAPKTIALACLLLAAPALAAPDVTFVSEAMKGDNAEVAMGKLALEKGASAKVRDFGKMLVADHGGHKSKLVALGAILKVPATDAVPPAAAKTRDMLAGLSGGAFDKAFKQHMIEDHKKDIAKYEAQAKQGQSPKVRALAQQTLPTLRKHLSTAQAL